MTTMIVEDLGRIPMSPYLTATLTRAADYATAQAHREVTLEHLLLALAEDPEATVVLKSSSIDLGRLAAEVSDYLGRSDDRIDPASGETIAISADLRRILEAAAAAARQGRRREINGAIVLAAIVGDGKSTAAHLLRVQGLTFEAAIRALQRATPLPSSPPEPQPPSPAAHAPPEPSPPQAQRAPAPPEHPAPQAPHPQPAPDSGPLPPPDLTRPATTEEILASARERLQSRDTAAGADAAPPAPAPLPRANYPDLGGPPPPTPTRSEPVFEREPERAPNPIDNRSDGLPPPFGAERPGTRHEPQPPAWPIPSPAEEARSFPPAPPEPPQPEPAPPVPASPPSDVAANASRRAPPQGTSRPGPQAEARRPAPSGPFVGSWPLIEAGQLVENIPRRMRIGVPVVAEARIARADVKALAEGLQGGGAAYRHEVVVTKAMSVRLRAPEGGFTIENRSPETQWIENVLGFGSDDYASWRWTVTPRARGRRQLQLIVSARTIGADGMTAETALPDQVVDVKVSINYARTAARWAGWIAAAAVGGLFAKFGETGWVIAQLLIARHLGG